MEIIKSVKNLGEVRKAVEQHIRYLDNPTLLIRRFVSLDGRKECMDVDVEIYDNGEYIDVVGVFSTDYQDVDFNDLPDAMVKELNQLSTYIKKHFSTSCTVEVREEIEYC